VGVRRNLIRECIGADWVLADVLEELHSPLHLGPAGDLGRVHLAIVRSDDSLLNACYVDREVGDREETDLGRDFHRVHDADTVHWWLSRNAEHAPGILARTVTALEAAVDLKRASVQLRFSPTLTYGQLIQQLAVFCDSRETSIRQLLAYVEWLGTLDQFAPSMLFTTRVWSQSGRIDRRPAPLRDLARPIPTQLFAWVASETALGLWGRRAPLAEEFIDSSYPGALYVSALMGHPEEGEAREYVEELTEMVGRSFRDYFADLRQAIANVSMECKAILGRDTLAGDEAFWRMVIGELRGSYRPETELWDVKETLAFWQGAREERLALARKFCRRVAAFANTSGGAVIVGIADVDSLEVIGLTDVDAKIEMTRHALEEATTFRPEQVRITPVTTEAEGHAEAICLVVSVPRTKEPIGARGPNSEWTYPVRVDSRTRYSTVEEVAKSKLPLACDDFSFVDVLHRAFRGEDERMLLS